MTSEIIPLRIAVAPANVESNPARTSFRPTARGRIVKIVWQFPKGCNGTVHAAIESRDGQLAPILGEDIALGGGPPVPFEGLNVPIPDNDPAVRIVAWADAGNTYTHVIDAILVVEDSGVI